MVATSRAGEFGNFGEFKQRAAATENAVRNQRAEWAASPEGQAANVLQKMLDGMPGATQKEREWVRAAFFKRVKAGENPYAAASQILANVSARLLGLTGFDIGTDILQGNAGAFGIMTDAQRSDSARVLMGEAQRQAEYARTGGKPLSAEDMMQIGALARQAQQGVVVSGTPAEPLTPKPQFGMPSAASGDPLWRGQDATPNLGGRAAKVDAPQTFTAYEAAPTQQELDAARELQRAARELRRSADGLREASAVGADSRSITH